MVVDLPTPGVPVMPTRTAPPVCGSRSCTSLRAALWWSARRLSIRVMARASNERSPARMPAARRETSRRGSLTYAQPCQASSRGRDDDRDAAHLLVLGRGRAREHQKLFGRSDAAGRVLRLGAEAVAGRLLCLPLPDRGDAAASSGEQTPGVPSR